MKHSHESRKRAFFFVVAKIMYWMVVPFQSIYIRIRSAIYERRRKKAIKKADYEAELTHRKHYVVAGDGIFFVYNKGGLLNLAKVLKKKHGRSVEWRDLYIYETE